MINRKDAEGAKEFKKVIFALLASFAVQLAGKTCA